MMNPPSLAIKLRDYQESAIKKLRTGSILCGGVGSGKSLTALAYYLEKEYPKPLYIITTAAKRNSGEWNEDCDKLGITPTKVDSWNRISEYRNLEGVFIIFDEQRVVGSGAWVKSFIKIAKKNDWILLSATPGDTWMDYIPVFMANGFYKTRTEFILEHVIWNNFAKFPKVERYVGVSKLARLRNEITVVMDYKRTTEIISEDMIMPYDEKQYDLALKGRWNPYTNLPIKDIAELCQVIRRIVNSDESRLARVTTLIKKHQRAIIFYNYNYELEILRNLVIYPDIVVAEYNGHKHEPIPDSMSWAYLVQYTAGAEGWNCIEANTVIFYSLNYSHRVMTQAAGRIDRLNTPFSKLYNYRLTSQSPIDLAISKALSEKKDFNESKFFKKGFALET